MALSDALAEGTQAALRSYQAGRLEEARRQALDVLRQERHPGALHLLALIDLQTGLLETALAYAEDALALRPDSAPILNTLGAICRYRGDELRAEGYLRRALESDPALGQAHYNLASLLHRRSAWGEAREHYQQALLKPLETPAAPTPADLLQDPPPTPSTLPPDLAARQGWLACLLRRVVFPLSPSVRQELWHCFEFAGLDLQAAGGLVLQAQTHHPSWPALVQAARARDEAQLRALSAPFWSDPLLQRALRFSLCLDSGVEEVLTAWRRSFALYGLGGSGDFGLALAFQCQNNEFIFAQSPQEEAALEQTQDDSLVVISMYRPPARPRAAEIVPLTAVADPVSRAVQGQYEEHPYPRWLSLHRARTQPLGQVVQSLCGKAPEEVPPSPRRVLVAGCGTGRSALSLATQIADAEVLALDLSVPSLAYGRQKAEHLGIRNVTFRQADILNLDTLQERFQLIDCSGVLHHLEDPLRGWRVLTELLVPGGLMRVGLYSRRARHGVNAARELAGTLGAPVPSTIRHWRQLIKQLPADHPARDVLDLEDFYSMSACRDLAFHVQEHQFDLPQVGQALEALGLELLGFELRDPLVRPTFQALFGADASLANLTFWEAFENLYPRTFIGLYLFWCRRT